jgi:hypothetical protein
MEPSILISTKKILGLSADYDSFDEDVVIQINSALSVLTQLGVGPLDGFEITGPDEIWDDFIDESLVSMLGLVKTYIFLKVSLAFDPPQIGYLIDAKNKQIEEHVFRITVLREELLQDVEPA